MPIVFDLTPEQEEMRRQAREFAEREITPGAEERDRTGQFDYELYRRLGELGVIGMCFSEEFGGINAEYLSYCLAGEEHRERYEKLWQKGEVGG